MGGKSRDSGGSRQSRGSRGSGDSRKSRKPHPSTLLRTSSNKNILSKNFKNKLRNFLTNFFFILERNLDFLDSEKALEKQKSRLYFSKT